MSRDGDRLLHFEDSNFPSSHFEINEQQNISVSIYCFEISEEQKIACNPLHEENYCERNYPGTKYLGQQYSGTKYLREKYP
jgi:hypothetical protein